MIWSWIGLGLLAGNMDFFAKRKGGDSSRAAQAGPSGKSAALKIIPWVEK